MTTNQATEITETGPTAPSAATAPTTSRWVAAIDELRTRRAARHSRRVFERDIASYTTPGEIMELRSILLRFGGPEADKIRTIIDRRDVA